MKDNLSIAVSIIGLILIVWGAYDVVTEVNNYNMGQGYWMVGIGFVILIVLYVSNKFNRPGR